MDGNFGELVLVSVIIGGSVLLLVYLLRVIRGDRKEAKIVPNEQLEELEKIAAQKRMQQRNVQRAKKKAAPKVNNAKSGAFAHPWLNNTFKGHTGQVLNMTLSSNGKYLASCADEDPRTKVHNGIISSSSSSISSSSSSSEDTNKENVSSSSSPSPSKGLTRRQRKNHRRREELPVVTPKKNRATMEPQQLFVPLRTYAKLGLTESKIHQYLCTYVLSNEQLLSLGYPVQLAEGTTQIFNNPPPHLRLKHKFDVNAREFVPRRTQGSSDSGQGSSSSSESEEGEAAAAAAPSENYAVRMRETDERICVRCRSIFEIRDKSEYRANEMCEFHHGKMRLGRVYTCCGGDSASPGCSQSVYHVWSGLLSGFNGPYTDFVQTKQRSVEAVEVATSIVFALDCEMVYTIAGMELARVTVIGVNGRVVYDAYVRPRNKVFDYNTLYSGITRTDLENAEKTLGDVQKDLLQFIFSDTILIGHGLENDLRALKIVHKHVVDTAIAFPHFNGLPSRHSLKFLVKNHLGREIQNHTDKGHDSAEDSQACMDLMLWRIHTDFEGLIHHSRW